jgi:adenine-specific DNA-methyltransferase
MKKLKLHTPDLTEGNIDRIAALFPNCVTEALDEAGELKRAIDFDLLRQELAADVVEGPQERYRLDWPGKRAALALANAPVSLTLRPCVEESVDFENTQHLYIEGDNLDALKLLQETYLGKVKMIYIDPPYNTGNDFIYDDDFSMSRDDYASSSGAVDEEGNVMFDEEKWKQNSTSNGRFHSEWLSMMYPRLKLARNLMRDDGVIFISIDDSESHNLRKLLDEIFGVDNFIGAFSITSSPSAIDYGHIAKTNEYCLFFAKDLASAETRLLQDELKSFKYKDDIGDFNLYPLYNGNVAFNPKTRPNLYYPFYLNPNKSDADGFFEIDIVKREGWAEVFPVVSKKEGIPRVWRWGKPKSKENLNKEIVGYQNENGEYRIVQKTRLTGKVIRSVQDDKEVSSRRGTAIFEALIPGKIFPFPKPTDLIKRFCSIAAWNEHIILDFFSGSATTAHAVMQLNAEDGGKRRHIMVQLPEPCDEKSEAYKAGYQTIAEIGKERIRRAGQKVLSEWHAKRGTSPDHLPLVTEHSGGTPPDIGFRVLKIDSSNFRDVTRTPDELDQAELSLHTEHIKPDRTPQDLLFQVLVDWGVDLALPIREEKITAESTNSKGKQESKEYTVYWVDENVLAACFDAAVPESLIHSIAARKPLRAVFRDESYDDDSTRINVEQIFKLLSPATEVKSL